MPKLSRCGAAQWIAACQITVKFSRLITVYHDYAYDIEDLAAYYREFDGLIAHWRE